MGARIGCEVAIYHTASTARRDIFIWRVVFAFAQIDADSRLHVLPKVEVQS